MSVDVEDYFQVEAFADCVSPESWDSWPSRVAGNTRRILDLFDELNIKATFFFVGWIAKKFPSLVREVVGRGHEVACHSYWHRAVYKLTPQEFREDTRRARDVIQEASGIRVLGYRAPTWSITRACLWAIDILTEEGFEYDSSIYPIHHDLYGMPNARRFPYTLEASNGQTLREFPPATVSIFGLTLPAAGGGYLRIFPQRYNEYAFRQGERAGEPVSVYFHPWEIDPEQPRISGRLRSRFRHYTNLHKMEDRLVHIMCAHQFGSYRDRLNAREAARDPANSREALVRLEAILHGHEREHS